MHVIAVVAQCAPNDGPLIQRLACDNAADDRRALGLAIATPILLPPKQHVSGHGSLYARKEAAVLGKMRYDDALLGTKSHRGRAHRNTSETDNSTDHVRGNAADFVAICFGDNVEAIFADVGALGGDVERV